MRWISDVRYIRTIRFPYSRHSSFAELCGLVDAFKPKDVFPCTVDEKKWDPELSMQHLFGPFCSSDIFRHDNDMMKIYEARLEQEAYERRMQSESQNETQSSGAGTGSPHAVHNAISNIDGSGSAGSEEQNVDSGNYFTAPADVLLLRKDTAAEAASEIPAQMQHRETLPTDQLEDGQDITITDHTGLSSAPNATPSTVVKRPASEAPSASSEQKHKRLKNWEIAYEAALGINGLTWADYGGLVSARPQTEEEEL
jgi:hypothetical protein